MAALCLTLPFANVAQAQQISPLRIGQTIPDQLWNMPFQVVNHPQGRKTNTLSEYRDKLIILDFWATYCHPCVASLDKLDSLKEKFKGLVVIPVQVYDTPDRAVPFMTKRGWTWPSITADTLLNKKFFSNYLTGFGNVWIYKGKLLAVPVPMDITYQNIEAVLNGESPRFTNLPEQKQN